MEQMVSTSLCGLPLKKAAIAIGIVHSVLFSGLFFYETALVLLDCFVLYDPPGLLLTLKTLYAVEMFNNEAFLCCVAGVSLVAGAWKGEPGLVITWLLQQAVMIFSSFLTLFYYVVAHYLKAPALQCFFELFLNAIQGYFFLVVYAHFLELRKGNLVS